MKEKYQYRDEKKLMICFDTLFCNFPHYEYLTLAFELKDFLNHNREKEFMEDIRSDERQLRGYKVIFWVGRNDMWVTFWDNDLLSEGAVGEKI